jgi:hypothetical protein
MDIIDQLAIFLAIGLPAFLLLVRKRTWCPINIRIGITGSLFLLGVIGSNVEQVRELFKLSETTLRLIQIPLFIVLVERLFRMFSIMIHERDFILYMRASDELPDGRTHPIIKTSDYIFSIILIILIFTLPVFYGIRK